MTCGRRILVIEDEVNILMSLRLCLERAGYQVISTMNGAQGIEMALSQKPDLILLDLLLPDMHGLLVCQALKGNQLTASIPVVVLSAYSEKDLIKSAIDAGAAQYLVKPFDPSSLKEAVARYLTC